MSTPALTTTIVATETVPLTIPVLFTVCRIEDLEDLLQLVRWLFKDWLASSGNTKLSVEMLCACLEDIKRNDMAGGHHGK